VKASEIKNVLEFVERRESDWKEGGEAVEWSSEEEVWKWSGSGRTEVFGECRSDESE